jgi:hypothetical protein
MHLEIENPGSIDILLSDRPTPAILLDRLIDRSFENGGCAITYLGLFAVRQLLLNAISI